ncbi:BatD family protein [Saccharospirillum mangrovi]|uniref:BatD family protein n=1 Tax=Saccharospirillum mangrovi TaxID=2161747 RepID=UPI001300452F|nr:BatD family protein [Saccharospirillum mangrovi]
MRLAFLLLALVATAPVWAAVEAEVDRSRLYQDERLELIVRVDSETARFALDLTPLSILFDIEQQSQGQRLRRASNGEIEAWREWHLWLRPRHIGTLAIPPFRFGNARSERILVEVLDPLQRGDDLPAEAVQLDVTLNERELYIGQPTILTIDLWYQLRLQGDYADLDFGDFNVELLDESNVTDVQNGRQIRRYRLIYRLTANHPGELQLPPIRFVGQYQAGPYGERQSIERVYPAQTLTVKPIPDSYPKNAVWLPAKRLSLSDNLPAQLELSAHAHQDWTVVTEVEGLPPTRLPDPLAGLGGDVWRLYRNAPEFTDAQRRDLAALVFTEAGRQRLPAVRLPWWDLQRDQLAYAELPARTITVVPEASPAFQPTPTSGDAESTSIRLPWGLWPWLSAALGLGWLSTLLWLWLRRRRNRPVKVEPAPQPRPLKLGALLDEAEPRPFRLGILRWLAQHDLDAAKTLAALPEPAASLWARLNATLYGPTGPAALTRAERKVLLQALLKRHARLVKAAQRPPDLSQLYPD